ncbi:hypothetical protein PtA15_14A7 [Puccinia triticina]|uniref:DUF7872 domain-containing protein n=1 Tax=Puccinia triticina TaxID=208348 RepID=A0ABY7D4E0_9BASI|nr:uncharacterized protein PtA15_14A7 [Puccinia triticina]WAQ91127.1 hypothetical protein PtA15_14A7 [Puccinia triticina]
MQSTLSLHPATYFFKLLLIQAIVQSLLIALIPNVNAQALQVSSGRKTPGLSHLLYARRPADPRDPLQPYECDRKPLSPETWKELRIDDYLRNYPGGLQVNLTVFAAQNSALNFECGLNLFCSAGQLCSPISGRAWWVLAAAEQYTMYHDSLYTAIAFAAGQTKAIGAELVNDLYKQDAKRKFQLFQEIAMILTLIMSVVALIAGVVTAAGGAIVAIAQVTMIMKAQAQELQAGKQDTFTKWAHYEDQISHWQQNAQTKIGERMKEFIESPVSSPKGLLGALAGGDYCCNNQKLDSIDLEQKLSRILTIQMAGQILRAKT